MAARRQINHRQSFFSVLFTVNELHHLNMQQQANGQLQPSA
jgi:hypothetical protein